MPTFPRNIHHLHEKNTALLEQIGFDPKHDNPNDLRTPEAYRRTGLFTEAAIKTIFAMHTPYERILEHRNAVAEYIGMILVRPDMLHARAKFEQFIKKRFRVLYSGTVTMDPDTYWKIYEHDFHREETHHTSLTRAALCIGSDCQLIVFRGEQPNSKPLADHVYQELKGVQGVYEPGTLRGEVAYTTAMELGVHHDQVHQTLRMATDPFGAYRAAVAHRQPTTMVPHPLLTFTGVGVHIPNASEINTDLPQLLGDAHIS